MLPARQPDAGPHRGPPGGRDLLRGGQRRTRPGRPALPARGAPADPRRGRRPAAAPRARSSSPRCCPSTGRPTEHHRLLRGPRRRLAAPDHGRPTSPRGRAAPVPAADSLTYPREESRRELDAANFASAHSLIRVGETLQDVLVNNTDVARAGGRPGARQHVVRHPRAPRRGARRHRPDARLPRPRSWARSGSRRPGRSPSPAPAAGSRPPSPTASTSRSGSPSRRSPTSRCRSPCRPRSRSGPAGAAPCCSAPPPRRPGIHNVTLRLTDATGIAAGRQRPAADPLGPGQQRDLADPRLRRGAALRRDRGAPRPPAAGRRPRRQGVRDELVRASARCSPPAR